MESSNTNVKTPVKRLSGQLTDQYSANQKYSSFQTCSREKSSNGKIACTVHKNKNSSMVPKIVRVQSKPNVMKSAVRLGGKLDESGDNKSGPSKMSSFSSRKNIAPDKLKPSHIPRRKITSKDSTCNKEHSTKKDCQFLGGSRNCRNVQRIQLLINQDFRQEDRVPATSIASTRPIPTLGQIYEHNVIDPDRLDANWFVELDTPANSMASNFFNISSRFDNVCGNAENDIAATNKYATAVANMEFDGTSLKQNVYKTTEENISDWLGTDMEYPTRDNESGYRSLSPPTHIPTDVKSKNSKSSFLSGRDENVEKMENKLSRSSSKKLAQEYDSTETAGTLNEQQTVVLSQPTQSPMKRETTEETEKSKAVIPDQSKNYQYPSRVNCSPPAPPSKAQVTVPSYVECSSEILQKTTNFEDMIPVTCDSPNTISSSIGGAETDFHDDLSSQYTLEQGECCLHEHCTMEWCHQCRSCERDEKSNVSEDTSVADSLLCHYNDSLLNGSDDQYVHHCRWKSHYEAVKHCKKCQRYRRFPSTRYKLPKTLSMLRKRMSMRICRRRLSRVWKKTTERWAMWSAKSPHKFRKLRMMHYLQRTILWEDADVQTNVFMYRETGTEPTLKELKSAGISAVVKYGINFTCSKSPPEKRSRSQEKIQEQRNSIGKENDIDNLEPTAAMSPDAQKHENHVITQTASCFYSKDKYEPKSKYDVSGIPEYKSESCIEICEVNMDDKQTGTEDMLSPMHDNVTCTELDLDTIQPNIWEAQNVHTQMQIVCNNAETDVKFPSIKEYQAENVLTSMSDDDILYTPCGTNTDLKSLRSINLMTSREFLKCSPTFSHIDTQITPVQSLRKISTGILTSKSFFERYSEKIDTSTEMSYDIVNLKDFTNQIMPHRPSFQCTVTKSTSTSMVAVNEAYSVTSQKDLRCTEVLTCSQVKNGVCLTSPYLQQCPCPVVEYTSCGTETNDMYNNGYTSPNKLKTYFNTGMLINTLVEGALVQTEQKSSSKDRYPKRLSVETNSNLKYASKSAMSGAGRKSSILSQKRTDNGTQYSHVAQKDASPSCYSAHIDQSHLISGRNLSNSADEAAQTEPIRIDGGLHVPQQYKCTSVFTSQCALDHMIPITCLPEDFGQTKVFPSSSQRKSDSSRNSRLGLNTSAVVSSDLDANKWIKSCIERGYQTQIEVGPSVDENKRSSVGDSFGYKPTDYKKSESKSVGSDTYSKNQLVANVPAVASAVTDMALQKYHDSPTKDVNSQQIVQMVDDVTSDEVLRKQVKEITLQASPESCEAATECPQIIEQKSASVLTSRYLLPHVSTCKCQIENSGSLTDCLFVYGKPRCVVHSNEELNDASVQISFSQTQTHPTLELCPIPTRLSSGLTPYHRSLGMLTSCCRPLPCQCNNEKMSDIQTPTVYQALNETTKRITREGSMLEAMKNFTTCNTKGIDAGTEANFHNAWDTRSASVLTSPNVRSAGVITSRCTYPSRSIHQNSDDRHTKHLEAPTHDDDADSIERCVKSHLVTSCRYYSTLLTRHLDRVRENLTKHLAPRNSHYQATYQIPSIYTEACTMKPSACEEFGCQTFKNRPCCNGSKYTNALTPAVSLIDIGQHDKEHLKSVYNMLMAIEGRLRRIKTNIE